MIPLDEFQNLLAPYPRAGILRAPTALEFLPRLSQYCNGPKIWVKREDQTGFVFGGNKLRKLDFVLGQAIAMGADTIISGGVVQSNSLRQTAAACAKLGLECHLAVYHGRVVTTSSSSALGPEYEQSGNALLNKIYGAHLHDVQWTGDRNAAIDALEKSLRSKGHKTFTIPYGVSNTLGTIGYTSAAHEILSQTNRQGFTPTAIVHCTGSGSTQAGLCVGVQAMTGRNNTPTQVVGIDIDAEPDRVRLDVTRLAIQASTQLGLGFDPNGVEVVAGLAGQAYGVPHRDALDALFLAGRLEALILDPVYSAKGLAGLMALIDQGRWQSSDHVVFIHTGGSSANFGYSSLLAKS